MRRSRSKARLETKGSRFVALVCAVLLGTVVAASPAMATGTGSTEQIEGSGSSWSANAIIQWISDVQQNGLQVVYTPSGSSQGRTDFANGVTDYAVSDIGYQGDDPQTGQDDVSNRPYAYLPIVAGGTAFPYQIDVGRKQFIDLRLSQLTLAKIFTDNITNWDDPEITADNNGKALPSIPIIPVVHSEGAGTTFQFTDWLNTEFPSLWKAFSGVNYPVEFWPSGEGRQEPFNGSDGVMSFIDSSAGQGSIGFDEYSYALGVNYPVVALENNAGYFNVPNQYNVAVSLTQAQINYDQSSPDYLLENLDNVYTDTDPRAYPLSSYSYMIEPTASDDPTMDTAKRQTLADFLYYSICQGQAEMGPIGYSPLPINLVEASFQQVARLQQADPNVVLASEDVDTCHNPTFVAGQPTVNYLAEVAPQPPVCAKSGQGPCEGNLNTNLGNPEDGQPTQKLVTTGTGGTGGSTSDSSPSGSSGGVTTSGSTGNSSAGGGAESTGAASSSSSPKRSNGSSSRSVSSNGSSGGNGTTSADGAAGYSDGAGESTSTTAVLVGVPTILASTRPSGTDGFVIGILAALAILLVLGVPPFVARRKDKQ